MKNFFPLLKIQSINEVLELVYVDDIVLADNSPHMIQIVKPIFRPEIQN